jgi:LytS/YehU family sensor histidine kinase
MNPHFIFNCLNSIQQFVMEKDVNGANRFITQFSRLIRQTLDNSGKPGISIAEEETFLASYLALEKMRFEDAFEYEINIHPALNKNETFIPPMLLQPFIENSIRHGLRLRKEPGGKVSISMWPDEKTLVCMIADNGVGRKAAAAAKSQLHIQYQSKGISITSERIEMMNRNREQKITAETEDLIQADGGAAGTRVTIRFPIASITNNLQNQHV